MEQVSTESQEKGFLNLKIFPCRKWTKYCLQLQTKKKQLPPLSPIFWWNPQKISIIMLWNLKLSHDHFLIWAKNPNFKILTSKKVKGQNLKTRISWQNKKMIMRSFQILWHFYGYFVGISSKIGGIGGTLILLSLRFTPFSIIFYQFRHEKNLWNPKLFFLWISSDLYPNDP